MAVVVTRSLLSAADSYPLAGAGENRLTEIFAEVLRSAPLLVGWLVGEAEHLLAGTPSPLPVEGYEVTTQITFNRGSQRPDLQIIPRGPSESIYFEIKLGADFTLAQRTTYPHRTVGIVPRERREEQDAPFECLTWTDVARVSHTIGAGWSGQDWRRYAICPDAPSQYRLLHELLTYLETNVEVVVPQAITDADIPMYASAEATLGRWDLLIDLVAKQLTADPGIVKGPEVWQTDGLRARRSLGRSILMTNDEVWPALSRALEARNLNDVWIGCELLVAPEVTWAGQVEPTPAFGVGAAVQVSPDWPPGLEEGGPFAVAAQAAGFRQGTTWKGRVGRIYRTHYFSDLVGIADSLDGQAEAVVEWVRATLADLRALTPTVS